MLATAFMRPPCRIVGELGEGFGEAGALHFDVGKLRIFAEQAHQQRFGVARGDLQAIAFHLDLRDFGPGAHRVGREAAHAAHLLARHVGADFVDAAAGDEPAARHDRDAVGERLGFFEVVRGEHDGAAFVAQLAHHFPERFARLHVEPDGGLIEKQQFGTAADRQRELHLALLAAGEFAVGTLEQAFERQSRNHGVDVIGRRVVARHLFEQFARTHHAGQHHFLHHHADAAASFDLLRRMAEELGRAFIGVLQS